MTQDFFVDFLRSIYLKKKDKLGFRTDLIELGLKKGQTGYSLRDIKAKQEVPAFDVILKAPAKGKITSGKQVKNSFFQGGVIFPFTDKQDFFRRSLFFYTESSSPLVSLFDQPVMVKKIGVSDAQFTFKNLEFVLVVIPHDEMMRKFQWVWLTKEQEILKPDEEIGRCQNGAESGFGFWLVIFVLVSGSPSESLRKKFSYVRLKSYNEILQKGTDFVTIVLKE